MDVLLTGRKVFDHLESTLISRVVKLGGEICKFEDEGLISLVLEHQLSETGSLVDFSFSLRELNDSASSKPSHLRPSPPLLYAAHYSV